MAEKSFQLFQVPQITANNFRTIQSSLPSPKPNDAVPTYQPPLYQLFSQNRQHEYGAVLLPDDGNNNNNNEVMLMRSSVPLGPFTGYASILKRSSFLKPAQQLLEDFCGSGFGVSEDSLTDDHLGLMSAWGKCRVGHQIKKDLRLVSMLDEVYKRCKLYCQQIQAVATSFEAVAGLGNAAPFISSAIRAISNHFGCLKNAILDQLHFPGGKKSTTTTNLADTSSHVVKEHEIPSLFFAPKPSFGQNPIHNHSNLENSILRSQRGLPEHAVAVLRKWLFEHFLHPYPTDSEKHMLAQQTGLSRAQISNWFINSRVRLWKPMVEEIHVLQAQKSTQILQLPDTSNRNRRRHNMPYLVKENPISNFDNPLQDIPSKRSRNEKETRSNVVANCTGCYANNNNSLGGSSASLALNLQQNIEGGKAAFKNWF